MSQQNSSSIFGIEPLLLELCDLDADRTRTNPLKPLSLERCAALYFKVSKRGMLIDMYSMGQGGKDILSSFDSNTGIR